MNSQIFKTAIPLQLLKEFLLKICDGGNPDDEFIVSNAVFKKALFLNVLPEFIEKIKPYYYTSKHYFLERKLTYNTFMTIIRQLCNVNNIKFTTKMVYDKSKYEIHYTIFL
jgi:hypothetical protein